MFIYECILNKNDYRYEYNDVMLWEKILCRGEKEIELPDSKIESVVKLDVSQEM